MNTAEAVASITASDATVVWTAEPTEPWAFDAYDLRTIAFFEDVPDTAAMMLASEPLILCMEAQ